MSVIKSISDTIDFLKARPEFRLYTPKQLAIHKQRISDLEAAKRIIKDVDYFGGIETLKSQAAIASKSQSLFEDESPVLQKA